MNRKSALIVSAFITAFTLAGTGIVVMAVRSASTQDARNSLTVSTPKSVASASNGTAANLSVSPSTVTANISSDAAASAATTATPGSVLLATPELVSFQGSLAYEVSLDAGKVYVDANSGAILYSTVTQAQAQPTWRGEGEGDGEESHSRHRDHEQFEEENHEHDDF